MPAMCIIFYEISITTASFLTESAESPAYTQYKCATLGKKSCVTGRHGLQGHKTK